MVRPKFSQDLRLQIWNKTHGKCFHCKIILPEEWDIDHYPVVYRDIEDQCYCWPLGTTTNPLSINNLQPSCKSCNRSGKFEKNKSIYCGHSQLRIRKTYIFLFLSHSLFTGIGILLGNYLCNGLR